MLKSEILKYSRAGEVILLLQPGSLAQGFILRTACVLQSFAVFSLFV